MPQAQDLKELREALGLTQQQVADAFDSSQALISLFELGKRRVDATATQRLAAALTATMRGLGSTRVLSFDEVFAACEESRRRAQAEPAPSPKPDLSAGLTALGDLPAVDQSTAAPTAQGV